MDEAGANVRRENQISMFYVFENIEIQNIDIFVLVRFAFLSSRLQFQIINRNKHLLFCVRL